MSDSRSKLPPLSAAPPYLWLLLFIAAPLAIVLKISVAAPVMDLSGRCVAAISIVAPEQRLGKANREKLIAAVRAAAGQLSSRLGAPPAAD